MDFLNACTAVTRHGDQMIRLKTLQAIPSA